MSGPRAEAMFNRHYKGFWSNYPCIDMRPEPNELRIDAIIYAACIIAEAIRNSMDNETA